MKGESKKIVLTIFVLLVSVSFIAFAYADSSSEHSRLRDELSCRINFNIGVLNAINNESQNSSNSSSIFSASISKLHDDLSEVQNLGNNTDVKDFEKNHYQSDVRDAINSAQSWKGERRKDLTPDKIAFLLSSYIQLKENYTQCEQNVSQKIVQERVQSYIVQLAVFQNKTNDLSGRGFDITSLNQLLQDAQTQIIQPLQSALASANTTQDVQTAVRTYCLYDGCSNGTNFHLEAKFDLARATIILNKIQSNESAFNLTNDTLSQAQQDLATAQSTLDSVGTSAYQQGQSQTIFSNIKDAYKIIARIVTHNIKEPVGGEH